MTEAMPNAHQVLEESDRFLEYFNGDHVNNIGMFLVQTGKNVLHHIINDGIADFAQVPLDTSGAHKEIRKFHSQKGGIEVDLQFGSFQGGGYNWDLGINLGNYEYVKIGFARYLDTRYVYSIEWNDGDGKKAISIVLTSQNEITIFLGSRQITSEEAKLLLKEFLDYAVGMGVSLGYEK